MPVRAAPDRKPFFMRWSFWGPQLLGVGLCVAQTAIAGPLTKENLLICVTPLVAALSAAFKSKKE